MALAELRAPEKKMRFRPRQISVSLSSSACCSLSSSNLDSTALSPLPPHNHSYVRVFPAVTVKLHTCPLSVVCVCLKIREGRNSCEIQTIEVVLSSFVVPTLFLATFDHVVDAGTTTAQKPIER